jgi:hypothetical protein
MSSVPSVPSFDTYTDNSYEISRIEIQTHSGGNLFDLSRLFLDVTIYESVFNDKVIGEILLKDVVNLAETFPIVGDETIYLEYKTKTMNDTRGNITIVGKVVAPLGKSRAELDKVEIYKLQFITTTQFYDRSKRVRGAYQGNINEIVNKIFREQFGEEAAKKQLFFNQDTKHTYKFLFPYWTPIFCMKWLSKRTISYKPSCFIFYEDVDGFHFKDMVRASQQPAVWEYNVEPNNPSNFGDINAFMSKVQEYSITSYFDRMDEYMDGMYSGLLLTHDITTKKLELTEFDYQDQFSKYKHMNKHPMIPFGSISSDYYTTRNIGFYNVVPKQKLRIMDSKVKISDNELTEKYFLDRNSLEKQFSTFRLTIVVPGNSSLRLLDTVQFNIHKSGYMDEKNLNEEWRDTLLSGKYIIVALKSVLNRSDGSYRTTIELAKDSLIRAIPDESNIEIPLRNTS